MITEETIRTIDGEKWAYGVMGGFLVVMFIIALTVWIDRRNRTNLEKITEPTAVGDPVTIDFDPRENPGREVLAWKGQPYFLQTNEPVKLPEYDARKVSKDDKGKSSSIRSENKMICGSFW